jgi:hypothetical protein
MAAAPGAVVVSYRRKDTGHAAYRIRERLAGRLGEGSVFMDVDSIRPGEDFVARISQAVGVCQVLLALIGREWTTVADREGRRLDDPDDLVAFEVAMALERGVTVVPVLIDGAEMPDEGDLPMRLKPLVWRNAYQVDQATFKHSAAALVEEVERLVDRPPANTVHRAPGRGWVRPAVVAGVLVAAGAAALVALNKDGDQNGDANTAAGTDPTTVTLQPVEDRGSSVLLTWAGPKDLDYAVAVVPEGETATPALARRVTSATVAVNPGVRYCARVSATDGGTIVSSNIQPVRGASCPAS